MLIDFYHRSPLQLTDDAIHTLIANDRDVAKQGFIDDRLKPITVERHGTKYWKYKIPVMQVTH